MLLKSGPRRLKDVIFGYFRGTDSLEDQPLPEVEKALVDDAPRIVRLTIWGVIGFFVFLLLWAHFAIIDEVTKGEGKAIPSTRIQKIQILEGGIDAQIYVHEGQIVEAGAPLVRLDDPRFASNVGETEADAKKGRISITSPLARALIGKKKGTSVEVVAPGGAKAYEITKVDWK